MSDWRDIEIQTLNEYLRSPLFKGADENGIYTYEDKDEGLKIQARPTGDYNFELILNGGQATENALEVVGDMIADTLSFWYCNNDSQADKLWEELYRAKDKSKLSETARMIVDYVIALDNKKS